MNKWMNGDDDDDDDDLLCFSYSMGPVVIDWLIHGQPPTNRNVAAGML